MRRWLREPLLHFLLLGLAIFVAYGIFAPDTEEPSSIIVTQGAIDAQIEAFTRTWLRPPTEHEVDGLIREYVREEVYYREGLALGLDRDDTVIRRRLKQKLEFVAEAGGVTAEPTDAELHAFLAAHADAYRAEERTSFVHVYLDPEPRRDTIERDLQDLLAQLRAGGADVDFQAFGDRTLLEPAFADVSLRDIAAQFGDEFAERLREVRAGEWTGPIESAYGVHAVRVDQRLDGRVPSLVEIRAAVRRDWLNAQRAIANERYYESALSRYRVTIEGRDSAAVP